VVFIDSCWYHCDLQGFSGKLVVNQSGEISFNKHPDPFSFMARDDYFLSKHIPADPMWQLKKYPQEIDVLISGTHIVDESRPAFHYCDSIENFIRLSDTKRSIKLALNAHEYNPDNRNILVVNHYNAAVELINTAQGNEDKLENAKQYLLKAKEHVDFASNGVQELKTSIDAALEYLNSYSNL